jgi:tetratricopeptide (TPR) repeat protein
MMCRTSPAGAESLVKVYEQPVVIPTYLMGPPDSTPRFYSGGTSQGAQHRIYPYPAYDNLTTEKVNKTYTMVYLENEYVKIGILPEIGGKVFEAIDKTDGYNFVYRQHVIKPALISLLGAWISGGMEWDVPHHHRATSFLPVQYAVEDNADQSKTVWVGELELRDRMRWAVGLTLHPGRSYLEAKFRMINRTPLPASMLCFSNVAVSVNDSYQVIFPPSTQHVTYHGKRDFTTWPIATTRFNNTDFTAGVDVSWYKNHFNSTSMFAWNYQDDFFAGYDHGRNAGTMAIADHNVVPGKKFFTWGNGPSGRAEDTLLTDSDGPYIELMVGAYSDNQPDYSWLEPFETRTWTQYWYPFRDIDGVKNANVDAAVNLDVNNGNATVGFYATAEHPNATVLLKLKDRVLLEEQAAIGPGKSYLKQIALPAGADQHDLRASISADGRELVAYSPVKLVPEVMPKPVTNPPAPQEIKTSEELYLTGLRIEQFHAPGALPDPYWQEALKRDAGDVRVNTALGIDAIKAGRFADAEDYLRAALARAANRYTMPKDGEAFYYLGLALKAQGKNDEAFTQFYKSTWSAAWRSPGYFELAQIATCRGDFDAALGYLDRSLESNALNVRALSLRSELLRDRDRKDESAVVAASLARIDPLDVGALKPTEMAANLAKFPNLGLEAAADDMDAGLWRQATDVLSLIAQSKIAALADYDLAYCAGKLNQPDKSAQYGRRAAAAPVDYTFPFQMEMIDVLQAAMNANPADSHAPYYLGNLLYDCQPRRAVELWEQSASLGADFPVVFSNLALVYLRQDNGRDKALAAVEKAVALGGNATVFNQLDQLYEENGVDPAKRLALMESHQPLIDRDDVIAREINLKIFAGKYDDAVEMLKSRFFRAWEGGGRFSLGDSWINANLLKGRERLVAGNFSDALADFQSALAVPANLQEATGNTALRVGEIQYWIGRAYEAMGQRDKAQQAWHAVAAASTGPSANPAFTGARFRAAAGGLAAGVRVVGAAPFYQALALRGLGETDRANAMFQQLAASSSRISGASITGSSAAPAQRARIADAHYLAGLGQFGLGNKKSAIQEFNLALSASPDHLAAKTMLTATGF